MPKVSQAHRAARREQILDAAMRVLGRKGFGGLTMGDVIGESGLSAGAVYTYFTGKDDLVEAIGSGRLDGVIRVFEGELATGDAPDPAEIIAHVLTYIRGVGDQIGIDLAVVIVQVMAEAMLDPAAESPVRQRLSAIVTLWEKVVQRQQEVGALDPELDSEYVARVLLALIPGFILQNRIVGPLDPARYAATVKSLLAGGRPGAGR